MQTEDNTSEFDQEDINQNKVMAVLAYIGILVLVPLLVAPNLNTPVIIPIRV